MASQLGVAYAQEALEHGVMATGKHFPGHGNVNVDSHVGLPLIEESLEELQKNELVPFDSAIKKGRLLSLMPGHLKFKQSSEIITISVNWLTQILRQRMGFEGLIISDSFLMQGISEMGESKASVEALKAGVDILLTLKKPDEAISHFLDLRSKDSQLAQRIDESTDRILHAKYDILKLHQRKFPIRDKTSQALAKVQNLNKIENFTCQAITLLKNENQIFPQDPPRRIINVILSRKGSVTVKADYARTVDINPESGIRFKDRLVRQGVEVVQVRMDEKGNLEKEDPDGRKNFISSSDWIKEMTENPFDVVLISTYYGVPYGKKPEEKMMLESDSSMVRALTQMFPEKTVWVAYGNPYLIREIPDVSTYVATFSLTGPVEQCVARKFLGEDFFGKSPVRIPGLKAVFSKN